MMPTTKRVVSFFAIVVLAFSAAAATQQGDSARPECGHNPTIQTFTLPDGREVHGIPIDRVGLSRYRSPIPEFNDCQRLLVDTVQTERKDGDSLRFVYGPLAAVYASSRLNYVNDDLTQEPRDSTLGSLFKKPVIVAGAPQPLPSMFAVGLATVIVYDDDYTPLGMKRGFNCVYFTKTPSLKAWMWHNNDNPECSLYKSKTALANVDSAFPLQVRIDTPPHDDYTFSDYPDVARWDWDRQHGLQYIGVKCGGSWCEIGKEGFTPSHHYKISGDNIPKAQRRVYEIKGWYDEQYLATKPARTLFSIFKIGQSGIQPSSIWGAVFPDWQLESASIYRTFTSSPSTSRVLLSKDSADFYKEKFGFIPSKGISLVPASRNVELLHTQNWQANVIETELPPPGANTTRAGQFVSEDASKKAYTETYIEKSIRGHLRPMAQSRKNLSIKYRDHRNHIAKGGFKIPGTTRWRWRADDETVWQACDVGCCEIVN
jgi:hypothetical protein